MTSSWPCSVAIVLVVTLIIGLALRPRFGPRFPAQLVAIVALVAGGVVLTEDIGPAIVLICLGGACTAWAFRR